MGRAKWKNLIFEFFPSAGLQGNIGCLLFQHLNNIKIPIYISSIDSNPTKVEEIFKFIQDLNINLNDHKYYKEIKKYDIIGVPVRFYLVPIEDFLDIKIEKLYGKLQDIIIKSLTEILHQIHAFNFRNCIRNRVYEAYSESYPIIFNEKSKISSDIKRYEESIIKVTAKFLPISMESLKDYKNGKAEETKLTDLIQEFKKEFNINDVDGKIRDYSDQCREQLNGIKYKDSKDSRLDYELFTDEMSLNEWFITDQKPKILLKTDAIQSTECT